MLAPPLHPKVMSFSDSEVPERESLAVWSRLLNKWLLHAKVAALSDGPFPVSVRLRALPQMRFGWGAVGASTYSRPREIVTQDNDDLMLFMNLGGEFAVRHGVNEFALAPGDAYVMACCELGAHRRPTEGKLLCLRVQRAAVQPLVRSLDDKLGRLIPGAAPGLDMLSGYLRLLDERQPLATAPLQALATAHVHDLLALALGAARDVWENARGGGLQAARLTLAKALVETHLADPELSAEMVARRLRISARSVQRLFEAEGATLSGYIMAARLAKAYAVLADPRSLQRSIGDIAMDCGFSEISYFNRRFRARYRASPSEIRHGEAVAAPKLRPAPRGNA